jgi:hypothetical protein
MSVPEKFEQAIVRCKANIYFDGKVVSHGLTLADGTEKTIGLIYPGAYHFNTNAPERMEVISGTCAVQIAGDDAPRSYGTGTFFDVPGQSGFDICVEDGIMEYVCTFM